MTLGSLRAPPLLTPFIKQTSCWFSSGPSQQALARGRARGQRGFGERRRKVCSLFQYQAPPTSNHALPQILPVPAKPAGLELARTGSSLNIT